MTSVRKGRRSGRIRSYVVATSRSSSATSPSAIFKTFAGIASVRPSSSVTAQSRCTTRLSVSGPHNGASVRGSTRRTLKSCTFAQLASAFVHAQLGSSRKTWARPPRRLDGCPTSPCTKGSVASIVPLWFKSMPTARPRAKLSAATSISSVPKTRNRVPMRVDSSKDSGVSPVGVPSWNTRTRAATVAASRSGVTMSTGKLTVVAANAAAPPKSPRAVAPTYTKCRTITSPPKNPFV